MSLSFQSPQWGDNSKGKGTVIVAERLESFSPRNGEIILKMESPFTFNSKLVSVPAMGR